MNLDRVLGVGGDGLLDVVELIFVDLERCVIVVRGE